MSYQPPINSHPPSVTPNYPADSMNRYLPPTAASPMTNGTSPVPNQTAVKQQFISPPPPINQGQPKPPMVQQVYSNGLALNSSNNSSRTASPALIQQQPINSANLPPSTHQQQMRPNVYGANAPSSQSMPTNFKPTTVNSVPTPPMPVTHQQSHSNVDRLTNNLQTIHLNNGHTEIPSNGNPQLMQQPNVPVNKISNGNWVAASPQIKPNMPPSVSVVNSAKLSGNSSAYLPQVQNIQQQQPVQPQQIPFTSGNLQQQQVNRPPLPGAQQTFQSFANPPMARPPPTSINQTQALPNQMNYNQVNNGIGQHQQQQQAIPPPIAYNFTSPPVPTTGKRPMYPPTNQQTTPLAPTQQQLQYNQSTSQPYNNGTGQYYPQAAQAAQMQQQYQQPNVVKQGFNSLWGQNTIDLMQQRHILPTLPVEPTKISLDHEFYESVNCSSE